MAKVVGRGRRWGVPGFLLAAAIGVLIQAYLPLFQQFDEWNKAFPTITTAEQMQNSLQLNETRANLGKIEKIVLEWHESLWKYRSDMIASLPLVDMDDEEDFELEIGNKDSKPLKNRSPWLTVHLFLHILLVALSHIDRNSLMIPLTALVSQTVLFVLFFKAKRLADSVSNAVAFLRRSSRLVGTQVSIELQLLAGTGTEIAMESLRLMQFQALHHKIQVLTDIHESHELGIGFQVPLVGTLDIDLQTLVFVSCGAFFELIILLSAIVVAHSRPPEQHRSLSLAEASRLLIRCSRLYRSQGPPSTSCSAPSPARTSWFRAWVRRWCSSRPRCRARSLGSRL